MKICLCICLGFMLTLAYGFNVKDFGAKGDGKTDDTAAIQKALTFIAKRIKMDRFRIEDNWYSGSSETCADELYFPEGTYKISKTLLVDGSLVMRGEKGKSVISGTDSGKGLVYVRIYRRAIFKGMSFEGGKTQIELWNRNWNASTVHVADCRFANASETAFRSVGRIKFYPAADWKSKKAKREFIEPYAIKRSGDQIDLTRADENIKQQNFYSSNIISIRNCVFDCCASAVDVNNDGTMLENCRIKASPKSSKAAIISDAGSAPNLLTLYKCSFESEKGSRMRHWIYNTGFFLSVRNCSFISGSPAAAVFQKPGYSMGRGGDSGNLIVSDCSFQYQTAPAALIDIQRLGNVLLVRGNTSNTPVSLANWNIDGLNEKYLKRNSFNGKGWIMRNKYQIMTANNRNITFAIPAILKQFEHKIPEKACDVPAIPELKNNITEKVLFAKDFGVIADRKTDNAAALEKALAAAAKEKAELVLPSGYIHIGRAVKLPEFAVLRGEGMPVIDGGKRGKFDLFKADKIRHLRMKRLILRNGDCIIRGTLGKTSSDVVFEDTVFYDTGVKSIVLSGTENTARLHIEGSLFNGVGGIDTAAQYNTVNMTWMSNNFWMDNMAFFTVRRGIAVMRNAFFVPYVSKGTKRTNRITKETKIWQLGENLRWVDNDGARIWLFDTRGGGEAGGYCQLHQTKQGGTNYLEGGLMRCTNKDTKNCWYYMSAAPDRTVFCGISGYPSASLLGVPHCVWLKDEKVKNVKVEIYGVMMPQSKEKE